MSYREHRNSPKVVDSVSVGCKILRIIKHYNRISSNSTSVNVSYKNQMLTNRKIRKNVFFLVVNSVYREFIYSAPLNINRSRTSVLIKVIHFNREDFCF